MKHHNERTISTTSTTPATTSMRTVITWYVSMLLLALLAGSMDWKMQRHVESMADNVQAALRIVTIDLLESLEGYQLDRVAHQEEEVAEYLEEKAQELTEEGKAEEVFSERNRIRGEYLKKISLMEQDNADRLWQKRDTNEALRQQLLANITAQEADEQQTLQQMRAIHEGMCNWRFVSTLCDTVGGITGLQQKVDAEATLIQSEWQKVSALDREERLEELVANMLQNKSDQFNHTATNLLHLAELWDEHAQREFELAKEANQTAERLEEDAHSKEEIVEQQKIQEVQDEMEAHQYLHAAQLDHINAYWCAIVAIVSGCAAVVYFVLQAAPRALLLLQHGAEINPAREEEYAAEQRRNASYCVNHFLWFLVVVGMTGYYFVNIDQYPVGQRFVILLWFSCLGTVFQTFFLHAIPRFFVEVRAAQPDLLGYFFYLCTKGLVIFIVCMMEVLFLWLSMGRFLFSPGPINTFNSLWFCLLTVAASLCHVYYFGNSQTYFSSSNDNESITVWRCDDQSTAAPSRAESTLRSAVASEFTPLYKEEILSSGTTLDVHAGGDNEGDSATHSSSESPVFLQYALKLQNELQQLLLPFEILVIASMVAVLRNCLQFVWSSQATALQGAVLVCALVLVVLGGVLVKDLTCEECYEISQGRGRKRRKPRPDALELVHV